jgi:hypothetical protein
VDGTEDRTYLLVGGVVFPIYGDEVRGWSPRSDDFQGVAPCSPRVYTSLDELFFALVNLRVSATRDSCLGSESDASVRR